MLNGNEQRRMQTLLAAELLHDATDPDATYPFEFIAFKLSGFRRERGDDSLLVGQAIRPDLRLLIDQLSRTLSIPISDDAAKTVDQLAAELNVSTKTINRWRELGLRWRWVMPMPGARRVIGFPQSAVEAFDQANPGKLKQASRFNQLSAADREALIERARKLAVAGDVSLNRVATHLAKRTGRASETVRLLLLKYERSATAPIFAEYTPPLNTADRRAITAAYADGVSVSELGRRYRRSRASIYRIIHRVRAEQAQLQEIRWIDHPNFHRPEAVEIYLRPVNITQHDSYEDAGVMLDDLPEGLQPLYEIRGPDEGFIRSYVLRYNFLKYSADRMRNTFDLDEPRASALNAFTQAVADAESARRHLVHWHLPAVLSVARRHRAGHESGRVPSLLHLLMIGHEVLFEAIEKYDASTRPTVNSYLTNRLLRAYATSDPPRDRAQRRLEAHDVLDALKGHLPSETKTVGPAR